jgi:hypothetical protein
MLRYIGFLAKKSRSWEISDVLLLPPPRLMEISYPPSLASPPTAVENAAEVEATPALAAPFAAAAR